MRFYAVGKWEDAKQVNQLIKRLESEGHECTHNWTTEGSNGLTGAARIENIRTCALNDADGVRRAECVVVMHHNQLCGGLVELGIALADPNKLIVVINHLDPVARRQPIFYWLPNVYHVESAESAVRFINQSGKDKWE